MIASSLCATMYQPNTSTQPVHFLMAKHEMGIGLVAQLVERRQVASLISGEYGNAPQRGPYFKHLAVFIGLTFIAKLSFVDPRVVLWRSIALLSSHSSASFFHMHASTIDVTIGVRQGSCEGPILFLFCMNACLDRMEWPASIAKQAFACDRDPVGQAHLSLLRGMAQPARR